MVKKLIRDILVVGHPRGGTGFASRYLRELGLDVKHEAIGLRGTSNWQFADPNSVEIPYTFDGVAPKDVKFKHVFHIYRNPVKTISSVFYTENLDFKSLSYRDRKINLSRFTPLEMAVSSYVNWHELIDKNYPKAIKLKVEDFDQIQYHLVDLGLIKSFKEVEIGNKINSRRHPELTREIILSECTQEYRDRLAYYLDLYDISVPDVF